jgi:2-keto-4-pentenoate hydratase
MTGAPSTPAFEAAEAIAARFVASRQAATPLADYPGPIPPDRASAYACQDAAIALWPDEIAGWKIGRPAPGTEAAFGDTRIAGPIFRRAVIRAHDVAQAAFIEGGFAAVEGEFVLVLGRDAPADKTDWTEAEAQALVGAAHIGVELAGSPFAGVNALGPTVTVSDFGNNAGLILGPMIPGWRGRRLGDLTCEMVIEGKSVGRADAGSVLGGPVGALVFLLGHCARTGRPLKAGQLVSTGAVTGVHEIQIGQSARADFGDLGAIDCVAVRAKSAHAESELASAR